MQPTDTDVQFHGAASCPACGCLVHLVGNLRERLVRWACSSCQTVGSAPFATVDEDDDDTDAVEIETWET